MYYSLLFSFVVLILFSCSSTNFDETKIDVLLQQKISLVENESSEEQITFLGKCSKPIGESMKQDITELGIDIQTTIDSIFTASGKADQIKALSNLDFIIKLELSVERNNF